MKRLFFALLFCLVSSTCLASGVLFQAGGVDGTIPANDKYWVNDGGAGDNSWNDADNWASSASGAGGAGVPDSGSTVYFDGTDDDDNCTVDVAIDIAALNVQSTYSGTLDFATYNSTIAGNVTFASTGTVDLGTGTMTCSGDFDNYSLTTFTQGTSTVVLDGISKDFKSKNNSSASFYNLTISGSYTLTAGNLNSVFINSGVCTISGSLYDGAVNQTLQAYFGGDILIEDSADVDIYRIYMGWAGNTLTIESGATVALTTLFIGKDTNLVATGGTASITGPIDILNTYDLAITGDFSITGNWTQGNSSEVSGAVDLAIGGNFAINGTSGNECIFNGPDLDVTGTATAAYTTITDSDGKTGTGTTPTADSTCTNNGGNSNWTFE